jgi:hypothetical protein
MAELIPLDYRIHVARSRLIGRWVVVFALTVIICAGSVICAMTWKARKGADLARLNDEYNAKKTLIQRAKELRAGRLDLASRMEKIQQLMDDKTLLLLLHNISGSFSPNDCLQYISIDAHGRVADKKSDDPNRFIVRLNGFTTNTSSLAELMTRLKKNPTPKMSVTPDSSRREGLMDGQVMRFQITCEKADSVGT